MNPLKISLPYKVKPHIVGELNEYQVEVIANQSCSESQMMLARYYISGKWLLCNCLDAPLPMTVKKSTSGLYFLSRVQLRGEHALDCDFNKQLVSPESPGGKAEVCLLGPTYNCELTHADRESLRINGPFRTLKNDNKIPQFLFTLMNSGLKLKHDLYNRVNDFTWCGTELKRCITSSDDLTKKITTLQELAKKGLDKSTLQACCYISIEKVIFHHSGECELITCFNPFKSFLLPSTTPVIACGYESSGRSEPTYAFGVIAELAGGRFGLAAVFLAYKISNMSLQFAVSKLERMFLRCLGSSLRNVDQNYDIKIYRKTFKCQTTYLTSTLMIIDGEVKTLVFLEEHSQTLNLACEENGYKSLFIDSSQQNYQGFMHFIKSKILTNPL